MPSRKADSAGNLHAAGFERRTAGWLACENLPNRKMCATAKNDAPLLGDLHTPRLRRGSRSCTDWDELVSTSCSPVLRALFRRRRRLRKSTQQIVWDRRAPGILLPRVKSAVSQDTRALLTKKKRQTNGVTAEVSAGAVFERPRHSVWKEDT